MTNQNVALADSLMAVFGYTRVEEPKEESNMELSNEEMDVLWREDAQNMKDENRREDEEDNKPMPSPKFVVGDNAFVNGTWREVVNVLWHGKHYEYEMRPYDHHNNVEEEME